jgi:hypothetical protein
MAPWDLPYVQEWAEYHAYIGVTDILLFLNNWKPHEVEQLGTLLVSLPPKCQVRIVKHFDGKAMQVAAYNQGLAIMTALGVEWCAFIDLDEFLKIRSTRKLWEILNSFKDKQGIAVNWRMFGSNGIEKVEQVYDPDPYGITDRFSVGRFTKCERNLNQHVKQILHLGGKYKPTFISPHCTDALSYSTDGHPVVGPWNTYNLDKPHELELSHYATKSRKECMERRSQPRADSGHIREEGWETFFNQHDKNEIEESTLEYKGT